MKLTIKDITERRKLRWRERGDLAYDRRLVEAAVERIFSPMRLL